MSKTKITCFIKAHDVISQARTPSSSHDLHPSKVLTELNGNLAHL